LLLLPLITSIDAFSFSFSNKPTQCANLTITVDGGTPPYRLLMVPSGPLVGRQEIRTIVDQQFSGSSFTIPPLAFPGESNFTAVMSDSTGIGTGGTSVITDVADSGDSSCLSTTETNPLFYLDLPDSPVLDQCGSIQVSFSNNPQGQVTLMGIIAGGISFDIPVPSGQQSVNWTPIRVPSGTAVMLVAGDDRGRGTGGSSYFLVVQSGSDSCLTDGGGVVCSSTNAPFAGGQYATGSGGGTVTGPWQNGPSNGSNSGSGGSKSGSKVGMIVGIVCGVVALILLALIFFLLYRRRKSKQARMYGGTKEVDLLKSDRPLSHAGAGDNAHLEPTPFYAPANQNNGNGSPTTSASGHRPSTSVDTSGYGGADQRSIAPLVPPSAWNQNNHNRPITPSASGYEGTEYTSHTHNSGSEHAPGSVPNSPTGGATGFGFGAAAATGRQEMTKNTEGPSRLRPVNVVQHADGGAVPVTSPPPAEDEVVELPPSYNDVRRADGQPHTSP